MPVTKPLLLLILDGFGYSEEQKYNAIFKAKTPRWDKWWTTKPHMLLEASGCSVGLPDDQMGNSEVGHIHIGAGRIRPQDFTRINDAIKDGTFFKHPLLNQALTSLKASGKALHIMGLLSPGGVHSHEDHLLAIITVCKQYPDVPVYLHLFLDGRDTPPKSALASILRVEQACQNTHIRIASISGRYYAMDRDKRFERIEPVYRLITEAESAKTFDNATEAVLHAYEHNLSDEFVPPCRIGSKWTMNDNDAVIFFNFRADRARQLSEAFLNESFKGFIRHRMPKNIHFISMTQYDTKLDTQSLYPPFQPDNTLGQVVAAHHGRQLRIAETEKYAHVTFFFNGGVEQPFAGEDRILIPSPKVATYDLMPEMSAPLVTEALVDAILSKQYDFIVCNFANADMVGHSGNFEATVKAIECLDACMDKIGEAIIKTNAQMLITADHGNAEMMFDDMSNQAHTAHTTRPVPLLYVGEHQKFKQEMGSLIDIAPTALYLMGLPIPKEMQGTVLMESTHE